MSSRSVPFSCKMYPRAQAHPTRSAIGTVFVALLYGSASLPVSLAEQKHVQAGRSSNLMFLVPAADSLLNTTK